MMGVLMNIVGTPDYASDGFSVTVTAILEISGKSTKTLYISKLLSKLNY
jgi:hypothetical protein